MTPLTLRRIIVFTQDVPALARWYHEVLGLPIVELAPDGGWADLDAGACRLALHAGGPPEERDGGHKLAFGASDVGATREALIARGATLGPVRCWGELSLCDGHDPEGNAFQLSNRP